MKNKLNVRRNTLIVGSSIKRSTSQMPTARAPSQNVQRSQLPLDYRKKSSRGMGLRRSPEEVAQPPVAASAAREEAPPRCKADSLEVRKCTLGTTATSSLRTAARHTRTRRATELRWKRRREEAEGGACGEDDEGCARVARVEQDQRERSPSSTAHSSSSSLLPSFFSPFSFPW